MSKFACPCCGHLVLDERICWNICPICYWEDDPVQIADPWCEGGANVPSLAQSQENFRTFGVMEQRFAEYVRKPMDDDRIDPAWRPVELSDKQFATTPREIEQRCEKGESIPYEYWLRNSG